MRWDRFSLTLLVCACIVVAGCGAAKTKTKTETFLWTKPVGPVYLQFQGSPGAVKAARRSFGLGSIPKGAGRLIPVAQAHGHEACSFPTSAVTLRLYGNRAPTLCKGIRKKIRNATNPGG
jgi:hypothetical protein